MQLIKGSELVGSTWAGKRPDYSLKGFAVLSCAYSSNLSCRGGETFEICPGSSRLSSWVWMQIQRPSLVPRNDPQVHPPKHTALSSRHKAKRVGSTKQQNEHNVTKSIAQLQGELTNQKAYHWTLVKYGKRVQFYVDERLLYRTK